MVQSSGLLALCVLAFAVLSAALPMPDRYIPEGVDMGQGGRSSVHGWLWMPTYTSLEDPPNTSVLRGYWSHHTPEFWPWSPHNFQLIIFAELALEKPLPYLPFANTNATVGTEYTFTPPYDFSLNDLIMERPLHYVGKFQNGSFDTTYERSVMSYAKYTETVLDIATVHYLNMSNEEVLPILPYLSYPRSEGAPCTNCTIGLYLAHLIYTSPDFDQVVHGRMDLSKCRGATQSLLEEAQSIGATWEITGVRNALEFRLAAGEGVNAMLISRSGVRSLICPLHVLEEIHCVVGPAFGPRCDADEAEIAKFRRELVVP